MHPRGPQIDGARFLPAEYTGRSTSMSDRDTCLSRIVAMQQDNEQTKILITDDEKVNIDVLVGLFSPPGFFRLLRNVQVYAVGQHG